MIVEDLVRMGATANETDRSGKTCMHLSAENGYIRVVEVGQLHQSSSTSITSFLVPNQCDSSHQPVDHINRIL